MEKDKVQSKRRESASGFHYVNLYQCCPRKFFFRYVKGWRPKQTPQALVFGSAFHEAKATFYLKKSEKRAIEVGMGVLEEARAEVGDEAISKEMAWRLPHLVHYWVERLGQSDLAAYKVLAVEKQLEVPIKGTPWVMTIRPDAILQCKSTGLKFVMETKTSGFSHRLTMEAVVLGDQATAYLWGVQKMLYPDVYAVIPDVAYWNSRSRDLGNIQMVRGDIAMRGEFAIEMFEMSMAKLFTEVNQRMAAVKTMDERVLFPRNSYYCLSYSKQCEYAMFCLESTKGKKCPHGFSQDKGKKELGDLVDDSIAIQ